MKTIAIFGDALHQRALANRVHLCVPLAHVARVRATGGAKRRIFRSLVSLTLTRGLRSAWANMMRRYGERFGDWPDIPSSVHPSANSEDLVALVESEKPDLVLVSGTDLVRKPTLDRFATKVMNLHTGISPYIKGAPNCTNWALALGEFDLIGNTIMWIDAGIDSGAIIATERTPLTGHETLNDLHIKVIDHAHDLYCRAISDFAESLTLPSVPQSDIDPGRLFLTRHWDSAAMIRAVFNHRFRYRPFENRPHIRLVGLRRI